MPIGTHRYWGGGHRYERHKKLRAQSWQREKHEMPQPTDLILTTCRDLECSEYLGDRTKTRLRRPTRRLGRWGVGDWSGACGAGRDSDCLLCLKCRKLTEFDADVDSAIPGSAALEPGHPVGLESGWRRTCCHSSLVTFLSSTI